MNKFLVINEECVSCYDCERLCPFDAIKVNEDGDILFRSLSCIPECELCSLACPVNAISYSYIGGCEGGCSGSCDSCKQSCSVNKKD